MPRRPDNFRDVQARLSFIAYQWQALRIAEFELAATPAHHVRVRRNLNRRIDEARDDIDRVSLSVCPPSTGMGGAFVAALDADLKKTLGA